MSVIEPADQEKEPGTHAAAAPGADTRAGSGASKSSPLNQQFTMLNTLRRARTWVDVYLVTGTCLHGQIRSFDANMLLLQTRTGDVALYHHAISSVIRAQKRAGAGKSAARPATARPPRKSLPPAGGAVIERGGFPPSRPPRTVSLDRQPGGGMLSRQSGTADELGRSGRSRLPVTSRRTAEAPPGVVVVRHKRVRTIVKPDDA